MNNRLSSLIHLLSASGFNTESSQIIKLSGGAIAIPQKMYDAGVEFIRHSAAAGLKKMFEDIPDKLTKVETEFSRKMTLVEDMIGGIKEFDALSDDEKPKPGPGRFTDGTEDYILISTEFLWVPRIDAERFTAEYNVNLTHDISITYGIKEKQYSFFVDEKWDGLSNKHLFVSGMKSPFHGEIIRWLEELVDKWSGAVRDFISETKRSMTMIDSLDSGGLESSSRVKLWASEPSGTGLKDSAINSERVINGSSITDIPVDLDGYKYFKSDINYPSEVTVKVAFFDREKDVPEEGKDDMRWGYYDQSYQVIMVGVQRQVLTPQYIGSFGPPISNFLSVANDSLETFGHELTHFAQFIMALNAGTEKQIPTGKKKDSKYNTSGILKEPLRKKLNPATGKVEWSLFLPRIKKRHFFGDDKPSDETMRTLLHKNEASDGPYTYDGNSGFNLEGLRLEHESRDIEQKTRLYNELAAFKKAISNSNLESSQYLAAFKKYVGVAGDVSSGAKNKETVNSVLRWDRHGLSSHWLAGLKAKEPKKWKQVVLAMYQELSKDPDILL